MATTPKKPPNIHQRILAITADAEVAKGGTAPSQVGGFAFHKIDDVEAVLKPLFVKHGVTAMPTVTECLVEGAGSWNQAMAHVDIRFSNADDPEDHIILSGYGQGLDKQDKAIGKAISYACKNVYLSCFHLKGQPDVEADAQDQHVPTNGTTWKRELWNAAKGKGWTGKDITTVIDEEWGCDPANPPESKRPDILEFFGGTTPDEYFEGKKRQDMEEIIPVKDEEPAELF